MPFGKGFHLPLQTTLCVQNFTVRLSEPSSGTSYHQCVYILCEKDEPLLATAKALREALDVNPEAEYMPHLSLLYSSMDEDCRWVSAVPAGSSSVNKLISLCVIPMASSRSCNHTIV
jgi:hypothetical protein